MGAALRGAKIVGIQKYFRRFPVLFCKCESARCANGHRGAQRDREI
jgi:hypothetical protein